MLVRGAGPWRVPPKGQPRRDAGLPRAVLEAPITGLAIDAHFITRASHAISLIVKGAKMIEAGSMPGETLIAEKSSSAIDGDIVVALVNDAYSVMRRVREIRRCQAYGTRPRFTVLPIAMRRRCSSTGIERPPPHSLCDLFSMMRINDKGRPQLMRSTSNPFSSSREAMNSLHTRFMPSRSAALYRAL